MDNVILEYLKARKKTFLLSALFLGVFIIVFALYNLPFEPVIYAFLLCLCLALIFTVFDFLNFKKKHDTLKELSMAINISIAGLPEPGTLMEKDYQRLIDELHKDKAKLISEYDSAASNMIQYYTIWAHQIKTPIAAMRLLLQTEFQEENSELSLELFKIEQYVDMVLQYLRINNGSTDFIIKHYNLDELTRKAVRKYAKQFIRKKIVLDFKPLNCEVLTDEKWLVFVIGQILSNAVKYTNQGQISIYLDEWQPKTLVVKDTGIGILQEDIPRIFENGYTGYNGRINQSSTGIGLYLSKQILTKLSHTISVESTENQGTIVRIGLDTLDMNIK